MDLGKVLHDFWRYGVAALTLLLSVVASAHALLYKRDSRAAVSWVGLVWLVPLLGAVLYFIFGVNRIKRRALELRAGRERFQADAPGAPHDLIRRTTIKRKRIILPEPDRRFIGRNVTH